MAAVGYQSGLARPPHKNRRGIFLVIMLVFVAILGMMLAMLPPPQIAARRIVAQREAGRQAEYLARAGVEFAIAEVLAGREIQFRQTYQPIPDGRVDVHVLSGGQKADQFEVHSRGTLVRPGAHSIVREVIRRYRLVRDGAGRPAECVFLEVPYPAGEESAIGAPPRRANRPER